MNAYENVSVDRLRFRGRARLAIDSDITDSITAGMRFATGNTSDLVSETQTLDGTAPYQIGLDELYIRFDERNAQRFPWLSAVGGRFLNPYGTPTDLIFHKDLTFTGVALTGRFGLGDGSAEQSHLFFTVGGHPLQEIALTGQDKWLVGAQLGTNIRWGEGQHLRLSGAFFDYFNVTGRLNPLDSTIYNYTAPQFERQGNTYFNIANYTNPGVYLFALAAKYRLADLNLTYTLPVGRYAFARYRGCGQELRLRHGRGVGQCRPIRRGPHQGIPRRDSAFGHPTVLTRRRLACAGRLSISAARRRHRCVYRFGFPLGRNRCQGILSDRRLRARQSGLDALALPELECDRRSDPGRSTRCSSI